MAQKLGIQALGLASQARPIFVASIQHNLESFSLERIKDFEPTHVLDCAFLTPDLMLNLGEENYTQINRAMMNNIEQVLTVSSVQTAVTISSGATIFDDCAEPKGAAFDLYGRLKGEADRRFTVAAVGANIDFSVARAWSVTGTRFGDPDKYAFSSLVSQAIRGEIRIYSKKKVVRRYCSAEDFLAVAFASAKNGIREIDSGGELVELSHLAERVRAAVNPQAKIYAHKDIVGIDCYHSDGQQWLQLLEKFRLEPESLELQIEKTAKEVRARMQHH